MVEHTVTYPNVAIVYDPIQRSVSMMVVPHQGETARFIVPVGNIHNILPSNDPFLQQQFIEHILR